MPSFSVHQRQGATRGRLVSHGGALETRSLNPAEADTKQLAIAGGAGVLGGVVGYAVGKKKAKKKAKKFAAVGAVLGLVAGFIGAHYALAEPAAA